MGEGKRSPLANSFPWYRQPRGTGKGLGAHGVPGALPGHAALPALKAKPSWRPPSILPSTRRITSQALWIRWALFPYFLSENPDVGGVGQEEVGRGGGALLETKRGVEEEGHQEGGWS